jgi:16S rRNA (adenine1518-N6/adenine1519-N6)-dimethyltransferase
VQLLTPASIAELLERHGLRPSRALGQHYLADPNTARRIVRLAGVQTGDPVLEIGPGIGSLTLALAEAGARVTALELDRHVLPALEEVVLDEPGVRGVQGDALDVDLAGLLDVGPSDTGQRWSVVANLPYNVATPIVVRLLEDEPRVSSLLVMVQREVGERLAAAPGSKAYGAVSVKVAYFAAAHVQGVVSPNVFFPPPKVESALVRLDRHAEPPVSVPSTDQLFALVRAGFSQRRKMLRRALQPVLHDTTTATLERAGIAPTARAEQLDLAAWAALARAAA